mgnify:CR=1
MTAKTRNEIARLKAQIQRLRPASAPGVRTTITTRGVTRKQTTTSSETTSTVPRWG